MAFTVTTESAAPDPGAAVASESDAQPVGFAERIQAARAEMDAGRDPFAPTPAPDSAAPATETPGAEAAPEAGPPFAPPEGTRWDEAAQRFRSATTGNFIAVSPEGAVTAEEEGTAAAAATAGDGAPTEAAPEVEPEPDESLVVRLRGRRDGEAEREIVVDDPELAERLRQNVNDGMRRDEFKRQTEAMQGQRAEIEGLFDHLRTDPVGFLTDQITNVEVQTDIVRHLLTRPEVYDKVVEELNAISDDPVALENHQLKLAQQRRDRRDAAEVERGTMASIRANVTAVGAQIERLGESLDEGRRGDFEARAAQDVGRYTSDPANGYIDTTGKILAVLPPEDVPALLEHLGTLRLFGLRPNAPAPVRSAPPAPPASPATPPAARPQGPAEQRIAAQAGASAATATGASLARAHAARTAAAAVAPAGAGPGVVTPPKPKEGQGIGARIADERRRLAGG